MSNFESAREALDSYLREVGESVGIPLSLDEDGTCGIECGDLVCFVSVPELGDVFLLHSALAEAPAEGRAQFFESALSLNLYLTETKGCTIAYDANDNELVLCLSLPVDDLDARSFANTLGNFILNAQRLRGELASSTEEPGAPVRSPGPDTLPAGWMMRA